jgi:hypothetical protein
MTIDPENLGNGAAKPEGRFAGQFGYRPRSNSEGGPVPAGSALAVDADEDLTPRNGTGPDHALDVTNPIASTLTQPRSPVHELTGPTFRRSAEYGMDSLLDPGSVADHPLLRGLLMELPPRGSTLPTEWLDRWFEAARSIMELLYRFEPTRD